MKIVLSPNEDDVTRIREALKTNDGYCPCRLKKTDDTKCMCKEFREQTSFGMCHCGLYCKIADTETRKDVEKYLDT